MRDVSGDFENMSQGGILELVKCKFGSGLLTRHNVYFPAWLRKTSLASLLPLHVASFVRIMEGRIELVPC